MINRTIGTKWMTRIATPALLVMTIGAAAADTDCDRVERRAGSALRRTAKACYAQSMRAGRRGETLDVEACQEAARTRHAARLATAGCAANSVGPETHAPVSGELRSGLFPIDGEATEITYEVVDGVAILGGDMILGTADHVAEVGQRLRAGEPVEAVMPPPSDDASVDDGDTPQPQSGTRFSTAFGWRNLRVPYQPYLTDPTLPLYTRQEIKKAVDHWNANTIVQLVPRTSEADYIRFVPGSGCSSWVGRQGGRQDITLSTGCNDGRIMHEIGHAVGLYHEQSRRDRDSSVLVRLDNVKPDKRYNFDKYSTSAGKDRGLFDFGSIMLYGSYDFSANGLPTLTRRDGSTFTAQRSYLSSGDIRGATLLASGRDSRSVYRLRNQLTGLCLEPSNTLVGATAAMRTCTSATNQKWYNFEMPGEGREIVIHADTGMCLQSISPYANSTPRLYPCARRDSQKFSAVSAGSGTARMTNVSNGLRLAAGSSYATEQTASASSGQIWQQF